jgi:hypothetical protein
VNAAELADVAAMFVVVRSRRLPVYAIGRAYEVIE